tara:strand:- start:52911 stop:53465 length:555 start_codon:yes stop_codon:yes gene_type:complete
MVDLVDVGGESCEPIAGFTNKVLLGVHGEFELINDPKDLCGGTEATTLEELVTIEATDSHTFPVDKGFVTLSAVEETVGITTNMIGEVGRRLFQNEATIIVSGSGAALKGFLRRVKNEKFIALFEEFDSGNLIQIGSKRFPAKFTGIEAATEALAEGNNSVTLTLQDKSKWPAAIYKGTVTMAP